MLVKISLPDSMHFIVIDEYLCMSIMTVICFSFI